MVADDGMKTWFHIYNGDAEQVIMVGRGRLMNREQLESWSPDRRFSLLLDLMLCEPLGTSRLADGPFPIDGVLKNKTSS